MVMREKTMALKKRMCVNHSERIAIGICQMIKEPICAECSTRYEGVNYSKKGLELLLNERKAKAQKGRGKQAAAGTVMWLLAPVCFYLLYAFYHWSFELLIDIMQ